MKVAIFTPMSHRPSKRASQGWLRRTLIRRDAQHSSTRLAYQAGLLTPYVDQSSTVLDVGCGNGLLASHLQHLAGCMVIATDITDSRATNVEFVLFDGRSLPFPNASIDYVTLSFVLHHSGEPVALCHEVLRVARRGIFVFEDIPRAVFQRAVLATHIVFFSWLYRIA